MAKIADIDLLKDIDILYNSKIVLYGAGNYGKRAVHLLNKLGLTVLRVCDSDKNKWGGYAMDIEFRPFRRQKR